MNSSLLPNDIQDIDGLELKEQVKVLKDYIEYMREQLQWFSSVTDKNEEGFVQSVTTYYGVSTSQTTPPSQWSTEAPVVSDGEYLWQYTKTTRSGVTTRSEPVCISSSFTAGEDAALVYIHSSNGNVFHAGNTGTVLTVTVYYGSDAIRTLSNLQTAFGSGAHLAWYVKEYGESTYDPVSPSDSRLSDNGFTFTLDADDVDTKASYNCRLMLSSTVTRSQSSITITDVDDGYTSVLSQESVTWNGTDTNLGSSKTVSFSVSGYCGPDTATFTIGTPALSDATNASASVSGSTVTLSVSSAATTGGTVTLPVIFTDGPTLHNTFSYFVVLKGAQGIQGDQGEQGIQGPAGEDGQTTYIHIKYSHTANPQTSADISDEPDDYIGICTNTTQTDPTDPAAYAPWTRFVGEDGPQGIPGETGEDGTTYYVHFAYGTSDQGADFSVTPFEGATYIGVCTDENELDPVTPASYTWSLTKGETGETGEDGVGIDSTTDLYFAKANSTAPSAPSSTVSTNDPTVHNAWNKALPNYSSSYPHYFTCVETLYTDGTRDWTSPVYDGALTSANQTAATASSTATTASQTASAAQQTANTASSTAATAKNTADTAKATADATKTALDNLEIGGRNLALGTGIATTFTPVDDRTWFTPIGFYAAGTYGTNLIRQATTSDDWVVSFDYAITGATAATELSLGFQQATSSYGNISTDRITVPVGNSSGHFSTTFNLTSGMITYGNKWLLSKGNTTDTDIRVTLSNFKFEKGNRATTWTPAPEDYEAAIADAEETATEALNKHGFCSCTTAAGTAAKTASLTGFQLKTGSTIHVTFSNANSVANPTLNINSTGAKTIKWNNANVTAATSPWAAGECVTFVYDGTNWVISGQSNITADNIVAGSIAADRIKANVISAVNGGTGSINADKMQTNVISAVNAGVGTINADKINVGGSAPQYTTGNVPYILRASTEAALGQESLEQIVGGSIAWNQIVPKTASGTTSAGITFTNNNDGSWTLTGTGSGDNAFCNLNYVNATTNWCLPNHKYYITPGKSGTETHLSNIGIYAYGLKSPDPTAVYAFNPTIKAAESTIPARGWVRLQVNNATNVNIGTVTMKPQIFDLTLTLGAAVADYVYSLESATAGAGVAKLKEWGLFTDTFYAYNAGELKHVSGLASHDTTGKNYFNPSWKKYVETDGTVNQNKGNAYWGCDKIVPVGSATQVTCKWYENPQGYTGSCACAFFDATMAFIRATSFFTASNISSYPYTATIYVPSGAAYCGFRGYMSTGASSITAVKGQIEFGGAATEYEPFISHNYPLDSTLTLRGVPKLDSNNKLYYDGDVYKPDGTVTRKYGIIDLGSLTWVYSSANARFYTDPNPTGVKPSVNTSTAANVICGRYQTVSWDAINAAAQPDKTIAVRADNSRLSIRDTAYTDATTFTNALSGVYLVYELATPTTETALPYQQVQAANAAGTESFSTTSLVPVGHYTRYASNLTAAMDSLPVDTTDAARTATNYITNINSGGITITGNNASSKIQIASTVKVIKDSTHFAEMTSSQYKIHAGNATYPAALFGAETSYLGGDGTNKYFVKIAKETTAFSDQTITNGGTLTLYSTGGVAKVGLIASGTGTQYFNNSLGEKIVRIGANKSGIGTLELWNGAEGNSKKAMELTTLTLTNSYETLVNDEPTLVFYDAGESASERMSWYSKKRAFIRDIDGNGYVHEGYVVHGETAAHGITVDYLNSGRINFYVDTSSIGYATITSSDERMKTDIEPIEERYKRAAGSVELKNFRFDFNDPTRAGANLLKRFGAIAQDVIKALDDEGINYEENELVETLEDDNGEYYTINYVPFLIARLAADEDRINELTTRLETLERR
jgi:hypothetical protein